MATHRDLDVLDAADLLADDVNRLLDRGTRRLIHRAQLRDSAGSIGANIAEGMTRRPLEGRNSCLDVSRGDANETIRHLRANYASGRITASTFFSLRNRLVTIDKMLVRLQRSRFAAYCRHRRRRSSRTPPPDSPTTLAFGAVRLSARFGCRRGSAVRAVPFFISTVRWAKIIGGTLVVSIVIAAVVRREALTSVWCFFAAIVSVLVMMAVRPARRSAFSR